MHRVPTEADTTKEFAIRASIMHILSCVSIVSVLFVNCEYYSTQMLQLCLMSRLPPHHHQQRRQVQEVQPRPAVRVGLLIARRALISTMVLRNARTGTRIACMEVSASQNAKTSRELLNLTISTSERHKPRIEILQLLSRPHINKNIAKYPIEASIDRRKTQIGPAK